MSRLPRLVAVVGVSAALGVAAPGVARADDLAPGSDSSSTAQVVDQFNGAVAAEAAPAPVSEAGSPGTEVAATATAPTVVGANGDQPVSLTVPGSGTGEQAGATTVFDGAGADNQIGVQPTEQGARALIRIESAAAPERYAFTVGGAAARLRAEDDGSITVLNATDEQIATVAAPWARDANGAAIPTRYEIDGTTVTQVVEHRSDDFAYPVVADPSVGQIIREVVARLKRIPGPLSWLIPESRLVKCAQGAVVSIITHNPGASATQIIVSAVRGCAVSILGLS